MVAAIHDPPLKGTNIAMEEQDTENTDPVVAETVDTDPAPPAEVIVAKEAKADVSAEVTVEKEAAPPATEVIEAAVEKEAKSAKGMRVRVRVNFVRVRVGFGLRLGLGQRLGLGLWGSR